MFNTVFVKYANTDYWLSEDKQSAYDKQQFDKLHRVLRRVLKSYVLYVGT